MEDAKPQPIHENAAERFRRFGRAIFSVPKDEVVEVIEEMPKSNRGRKPKPKEREVKEETK